MKIRFICTLLTLLYQCSNVNLKILGPPPGSPGTIDFRYPNTIVEPLPECPYVGVFPHPDNCYWYYRCNSHYEGYYHRTFYQCEPGTVFNDALDQCTLEGTTKCRLGLKHCNRYAKCTEWEYTYYNCNEYDVCSAASEEPVKMTLCLQAKRECRNCLLSEDVCGTGMSYSPADDSCHLSPDHPLVTCKMNTTAKPSLYPSPTPSQSPSLYPSPTPSQSPSLYPSPTPSQTPYLYPSPTPSQYPSPTPSQTPSPSSSAMTTTITEYSCDNCSISTSKCSSYEVCPEGGTEVNLILCSKAISVCLPCQSEENVCEEGKYFSMQDSKCYSDPDTPEMTCLSTTTTPHTPPPGEVLSSEIGFPVLCSNDKLIPNDDRIIKNFCSLSYSCERKARKFERYEALCDHYYQCVFDGDYWQIVKMTCSEDMAFSYQKNRCLPLPDPFAFGRAELCNYNFVYGDIN